MPPAAIHELQTVLPRLATKPGIAQAAPKLSAGAREFAAAASSGASPAQALNAPVFVLDLEALAAGRGLEASQHKLWTRVMPAAGGAAAGEVHEGTYRFAQLTEGPFVDDFRREVEALMADPGLTARTFDLALLRIPALYLNLIWLRDKEGGRDVLVPIGRTYPPVVAHHRYTSDELLSLLRSEAALRAQQTDGTKGG